MYDNLYPSRIIIAGKNKDTILLAQTLAECSRKNIKDVPILYMSSTEAESVKLFSNTYLAMRISFINELDTYAEVHGLNSKQIIEGIGHDSRIGNYYNNPSFGYGGYCLPKDTKQLVQSYQGIPNEIIKSTVLSNKMRKEFIGRSIINKRPKIVGVYRLIMKESSDNFRESAIIDIINILIEKNIEIIIYEPFMSDMKIKGTKIYKNLEDFKNDSNLIIANRVTDELDDVSEKIYSRDIFHKN